MVFIFLVVFINQFLKYFTIVPPWRNRFSKEYDEGLYTGTTLLLAYESVSLPFSIISAALSVCVLYPYVEQIYSLIRKKKSLLCKSYKQFDRYSFQNYLGRRQS